MALSSESILPAKAGLLEAFAPRSPKKLQFTLYTYVRTRRADVTANDRSPQFTKGWTPPTRAQLHAVAEELLDEHRIIERRFDLLYPRDDGTPFEGAASTDNERGAVFDSLLIRGRSLMEFYWEGPPTEKMGKRKNSAFAEDFFLDLSNPDLVAAQRRWAEASAPFEPLVRAWRSRGKQRVNEELAHLGYVRTKSYALPPEDRWWQPGYPWILVVVSARAFFDALDDNPDWQDVAKRGRTLLRGSFLAEAPVEELLAHVEYFVKEGIFTPEFT